MVWLVQVTLTLSDVLRSQPRFIVVSLAPVAVVMFTSCGAASSTEMAYRRPSGDRAGLRGDRYAQTCAGPAVNSGVRYSSRGLSPPAGWLGPVTGNGPRPVR